MVSLDQVKGETHMNNLGYAEPIGTPIEKTGFSYCENDNSHIPYTYTVNALACRVQLRCELLTAEKFWETQELTGQALFDEMFGG